LQRRLELTEESSDGRCSALTKACGQAPGPSSDFADLKGTATVTGVGFFDVKHGTPQTGVAPNNIELHPLLTLTNTDCSRR
jgi:hypothetical protein